MTTSGDSANVYVTVQVIPDGYTIDSFAKTTKIGIKAKKVKHHNVILFRVVFSKFRCLKIRSSGIYFIQYLFKLQILRQRFKDMERRWHASGTKYHADSHSLSSHSFDFVCIRVFVTNE